MYVTQNTLRNEIQYVRNRFVKVDRGRYHSRVQSAIALVLIYGTLS